MKAVPYYRVSTKKQGQSGLGLEAQQAAVEQWAKATGAEIVPVPPYVEVESGKNTDRPKLAAAIAHCKAIRGTLVVAKLDRLARNVAFVSALMESKVAFVACDNPHANNFTIHILAAVAEHEAKMISERTKVALSAYKARGGLLGGSRPECRNLTETAREKGSKAGNEAKQAIAAETYAHYLPIIREQRGTGKSLRAVAEHLNQLGYTTRTGKPWNQVQVKLLIDRYI